MLQFKKNKQYYKFCLYGFFKNLKFFEPFLMLFFLDKGITFLQIGTLYAIRELSINLLEIPTGVIADVLGRKKTMIVSFLGYILSFVIFYISPNFGWLAIAMLFFSFGDAMRTGTHKAMIFDYLKNQGWMSEKVMYYGHTRSWSQIGSAISSIIAAAIVIFTGNYRMVFLVSTLPYIADLILIWSYPKSLDGPLKSTNNGSVLQKIKFLTKNTVASFKIKSLWVTIINLSTYQGYFKALKDYLQPIIVLAIGSTYFLKDTSTENNTAIAIGVIYFFIYLISSFSSRHSGKVASWFKTPERAINYTLVFGLLAGLVSGVLILYEKSSWAIILFIIIFIIQNIRKPIGTGMAADKVKNEVLATGLSIQSQIDSFFAAIFAIIIGFMVDAFGIGNALFFLSLFLLIIPLFMQIKPSTKNR